MTTMLDVIEKEFAALKPATQDIFELATPKPGNEERFKELIEEKNKISEEIKEISRQQRELRIARNKLLEEKKKLAQQIRSTQNKISVTSSAHAKARLKKQLFQFRASLWDVQGKLELEEVPAVLMKDGKMVLDEDGRPQYQVDQFGNVIMRKAPVRDEMGQVVLKRRPDGSEYVGKITLIHRHLFGFNSDISTNPDGSVNEKGLKAMQESDSLYGRRYRLKQRLDAIKDEIRQIADLPQMS